MRFHLVLTMVLASAIAHAAEPNAADRESARVAFAEGNKLRDDGNIRGALDKYKAAYALAPTPVTALEVGRANMDLGHLVDAREVLLHVDSMDARGESAKAQAARQEAAALASKLSPRIARVTLRVVGAIDQTTVSVDGVTIPRDALAVARAMDPGRHAVLAIAFGHSVQQTIDVRDGEAREVVVDVTSLAPKNNVVGPQQTVPMSIPLSMPRSLVAFNPPEDGHAWSVRDAGDHEVCKVPCVQLVGFSSGYALERDDGQRVKVPTGLATLPGATAQVTPYAAAGSAVAGWVLVGAGCAAIIGSLFVIPALGDSSGIPTVIFMSLLLGGTVAASVGSVVLAVSHGPMLVRTDLGVPMRIAITPTGIAGVF